MSDRILRSVSY